MPAADRPAILIVEDAFLVGLQLKRDVEALGYEVLGPAPRVEAAMALMDAPNLACAILDVNLGEGDSTPVARALSERGAPFLFITGYESGDLSGFDDPIMLRKPATQAQIAEAIEELLA